MSRPAEIEVGFGVFIIAILALLHVSNIASMWMEHREELARIEAGCGLPMEVER